MHGVKKTKKKDEYQEKKKRQKMLRTPKDKMVSNDDELNKDL